MCLAVDSSILFANIQPEYKWAYFNNTLVYAFHKPPNPEMVIMFWDIAINEKHVRNMRNLMHVKASGEYCILVAQTEDDPRGGARYLLVLSNSVGCPIDSKLINIEPRYVAMNRTHVVVCSEDTVYLWQYRSQYSQGATMESQKKKKAGKENAFHIDEIPSHSGFYDVNKWRGRDQPVQDPIVSVAAGNDGFIVGRDSGEVYKYTLPYIQQENKFTLRCKPQTLVMNNDCSKFAIVDINGVLSFFDTEETPPGSRMPGYHLPQEKKEVWSVIWSNDEPNLCAIMEKNRLYVMRDFEAEEPVLTAGYLCDFSDLEVKAALLDDILKSPEDIKNIGEMIAKYECKSLRDTRDHLAEISLKDVIAFVQENPHPRLWKLICEAALDKLDFESAARAFVELKDYFGLQMVQ